MIQKVYKLIINGQIGNVKLSQLGDETFLNEDTPKNETFEYSVGHSQAWYDLQNYIYNEEIANEAYIASVRYFNLIQGVTINTDNFMLNYTLYQAAIKEIRKSGYQIEDSDINETEKKVKDKREIIDYTTSILSKVHIVVQEETALARSTAIEILRFFENIDIDDELETSDIRDLINDIQSFYSRCFSTGINISIVDDTKLKKLKESASDIAKAMLILQNDFSDEEDISVLYAFSSNPIGVVKPLLDLLKKASGDIDTVFEQKKNEKDSLTRKGNWNDSVDPRFIERLDDFNDLLTELKEV